VSGFSNGAQMSARLMIERSRTFAAFAMAAGGPSVPGPAERPAPAVFSVGSLDEGFTMAAGVPELAVDETVVENPALRGLLDTVALDLHLDNTLYTYAPTQIQGKAVPTFAFSRSLIGAQNAFTVLVIEDATHQYPNGVNHPVVMTDLLWPIFSRYTLP
jgi:poly(3-hydroxybutyrate) depolymerase